MRLMRLIRRLLKGLFDQGKRISVRPSASQGDSHRGRTPSLLVPPHLASHSREKRARQTLRLKGTISSQ